MDATTVAMCDLEDRIASDYETGFSEQALRQLMKETFLLEMERKRQMGEAILSGGLDSARLDQCIGWASSGAGLGNHCVAIVRLTPMVAVGLRALTAQPLK